MPIGLAVGGANTHDQKLLRETLDSIPVRRPKATSQRPQHLCGDKGYDCDAIRTSLRRRGYQPHIKSRFEERIEKRTCGKRARRWVAERAFAWLNRYRRILVRWEKKIVNYQGMMHLVLADILLSK